MSGAAPGTLQRRTADDWRALGVCCPSCTGSLDDAGDDALACTSCRARWPVRCGIPDLRTGSDPYLSTADDIRAAERLLERSGGRDFAALYASYYEGNAKVTAEQAARFTHGVLAAGDRALATLATWEELGVSVRRLAHAAPVLDLGCGTAPLAIAIAADGGRVLGIDVGLRWLVLARARAAARGIDLPVVCANAESLPIAPAAAAAVVGESVLENVADADRAIAECARVLTPGGALALTTPNRRSLGPDPHLGLLAGGWRSEAALRAFAERTGQVMPQRQLFAPGELVARLQRSGFAVPRVALPRFTEAQRAGLSALLDAAIGTYHLARRIPVVGAIVLQVAPTFAIAARTRA